MKNPDVPSSPTIVVFTDHSKRRGQARGITLRSAELATRYGMKSRVRGGCHRRVLTKSCMSRARTAGVTAHEIEVARGVQVIVDERNQGKRIVVTIGPKLE